MKKPEPYLLNVLDGMAAVTAYRPKTREEFLAQPIIQDAILMRLQDIGENLTRLRDTFPDFWEAHESDSWNKAIGLRNIISHAYGEVNLERIWDIIADEFEAFHASITAAL